MPSSVVRWKPHVQVPADVTMTLTTFLKSSVCVCVLFSFSLRLRWDEESDADGLKFTHCVVSASSPEAKSPEAHRETIPQCADDAVGERRPTMGIWGNSRTCSWGLNPGNTWRENITQMYTLIYSLSLVFAILKNFSIIICTVTYIQDWLKWLVL